MHLILRAQENKRDYTFGYTLSGPLRGLCLWGGGGGVKLDYLNYLILRRMFLLTETARQILKMRYSPYVNKGFVYMSVYNSLYFHDSRV